MLPVAPVLYLTRSPPNSENRVIFFPVELAKLLDECHWLTQVTACLQTNPSGQRYCSRLYKNSSSLSRPCPPSTAVSLLPGSILVPKNGTQTCGHSDQKTHALTVTHAWATGCSWWCSLFNDLLLFFFSDILVTFSIISFPSSLLSPYISSLSFPKLPCHLLIKPELQWWQWRWWLVNSFSVFDVMLSWTIFCNPPSTTTVSKSY